jgi:hypothetical protein
MSHDLIQNGVTGVVKRGSKLVFVEPEPAEPKPVYTGVPLEAFPPTKIKKEALWSVKKRRPGRRPKDDTPSDDVIVSDQELSEIQNVEAKYTSTLSSRNSEKLTNPSNIRTPLKIKLRQNQNSSLDTEKTPKTKRKGSANPTPTRSSKRIKVISPKKHASTNLAPVLVTENGDNKPEDDATKDNDDFCSACGGSGIFICCESCPKSFHFTCCDPPLEEVPEDHWFCRQCIAQRDPNSVKKWNDIGIFSQLLNQLESRCPLEFQLPHNLREDTFIGVSSGDNGEYQDESFLPELSYTKANGSQIKGYNKNVDLEIDNLYDKNGDPYLCHKCGDSGLNRRTLIHCDYCSLVWHLDCLDTPMCSPKTIGTKWRCSNHIEDLLPHNLLNFRILKDTDVRDISLYNHFLRIANASNFVIHHDDQPYLKDNTYPHLADYLHYENEDFDKEKNDNSSSSPATGNREIALFFQNVSVEDGVSAKVPSKLVKLLNHEIENRTIFRVPAKLIVLDFVTKVSKEGRLKIMENLQEYDCMSRIETNKVDHEVYETLSDIKTKPRHRVDFDELVKVALQQADTDIAKPTLQPEEIEDLLHIKKLMELKGREALLKFLQ